MPIIGVSRCLEKPFCALRFRSKRKSEFGLRPSYRSLCPRLNSVCSKRLPWKKYFHLLNSYNIKRVFGVVYC
ncbi:BJ4_G0038640.mRNA.1.CDS.1 [Saccharomyces cerevisiae]|nr:BJ4_G0038640.mRNA.1.CDS.1 [Saccharomyces cerevisiae]